MKDGFRQCTAWLHTWAGLIAGWVLFFVFVTGTAGYFQTEISRYMRPELPFAKFDPNEAGAPLPLDAALERLEEIAPAAASWSITLPHYSLATRDWQGLSIRWEKMAEDGEEHGVSGNEQLDPRTGQLLAQPKPRATSGGLGLYRMHYALRYIPYEAAFRLVGVCTMLMLLAIVTGVITHKKMFKDFFTFRPGRGQRSWLDAHNVVSVLALPFILVITYSGLVFFQFSYMPAAIHVIYGSSEPEREHFFHEYRGNHDHLPISRPAVSLAPLVKSADALWGQGTVRTVTMEHLQGEEATIEVTHVYGGSVNFFSAPSLRYHAETGEPLPSHASESATLQTESVILALHEGRFADPWTRWLYFVAGLLGCVMIGTGLVLWTVKRRRQHLAAPNVPLWEGFGLRLVETLNVGTIAGLPIGIAAFFWANRLLPIELANRAEWELDMLFIVWSATFFIALLRPLQRAWIELLWVACGAFVLLPVLNAFTTQRHLGVSLPQGDWVMAGTDLTLLGLALLFGYMAHKVDRHFARHEALASSAASADSQLQDAEQGRA